MTTKWYHPDAKSALEDMLESTYDKYMKSVEDETGDELSREMDEPINNPDDYEVTVQGSLEESLEVLPDKVAVAEGEREEGEEGEDSDEPETDSDAEEE